MTDQVAPNVAASLFVIHKVLTRSLEVMGQNADPFSMEGAPRPANREGFLNYCRAFVSVLDAHHQTEDLFIFPYFENKLPGAPFVMLTRQHQKIILHLERIQKILEQVEPDDQDKARFNTLKQYVEKINRIWHPHIRIEEQHFDIQNIGAMLPVEEHLRLNKEVGEYSQAHSGPPFLTIPFVLFNLQKEYRAAMAKGIPSEVVEYLVPVVWKAQWQSMKPFLLE